MTEGKVYVSSPYDPVSCLPHVGRPGREHVLFLVLCRREVGRPHPEHDLLVLDSSSELYSPGQLVASHQSYWIQANARELELR